MTWGELKALATTFVHRSDLNFDALQPLACVDISISLVVQENESFATLAPVGPDANSLYQAPLPASYALMRSVRQSGATLNPVDIKTLIERGGSHYSVSGGQLWVTNGASLSIVYSERVLPTSTDAGTNDVLDRYPSVYLYAVLKHAAVVMQDPDMNSEFYEKQFLGAVSTANAIYLDAAFGPGMMAHPMGAVV